MVEVSEVVFGQQRRGIVLTKNARVESGFGGGLESALVGAGGYHIKWRVVLLVLGEARLPILIIACHRRVIGIGGFEICFAVDHGPAHRLFVSFLLRQLFPLVVSPPL